MTPQQSDNLSTLARLFPQLEREVKAYDEETGDAPAYAYTERSPDSVTAGEFLREITHVIVAASLSSAAVQSIEAAIAPYLDYAQPRLTAQERAQREAAVLERFGHRAKVAGIFDAFDYVAQHGIDGVIDELREKGPKSLQRFKGIGPTSCRHLAKNLGYRTSMHDRHIERLAQAAGFDNAGQLPWAVLTSRLDAESVSWVEYVFWRYVTALDGEAELHGALA
ncbi:hypothetical protein [Persicimonas caeni]|uniref:hypothetical protein n=1 Tax=Persicimonas caeni TaxID=2292766 RepID=UPI00143D6CC4|nr:hypothetical protein [Persicimonas caeni]